MTVFATSAIDRRAPAATAAARVAAALLAAIAASAPVVPPAGPADLAKRLDKTDKLLLKIEDAVRGRDPGRASLLLRRADDEIAAFEAGSRIEALGTALEAARAAAASGDLAGAVPAVQRVRALYPPLLDYVITRDAEVAGRAALAAAENGNAAACREALGRLDGALLPATLLRRLHEARQAVARSRAAIARQDRRGSPAEVAKIRQALDGLRYAGALSRATFGLGVASELLEQGAVVAARDQVQKALRDLRMAAPIAPEADRPEVERTRDAVEALWRRSTRPEPGDAVRLREAQQAVGAARARQG